jgi:phosphoribosylaminoimidazole-succinocarboxamide synthase
MVGREKITALLGQAVDGVFVSTRGRKSGKVRDWFDLDGNRRLIVTTDRLSAFDKVLTLVPFKGQVLNQLSAWWFENTADIIHNHLLAVPDPNASIVERVEPLPVEVIVRGYMTGVTHTALWYRYSLGERKIYGYDFPEGLRKNWKLPEPIITPTTKGGPSGHDERLTCAEVVHKGYVDPAIWKKIEKAALGLFRRGEKVAQRSGLILVDTKYEFGLDKNGDVVLIDEIHTPDSSRFWDDASYEGCLSAGTEPESRDKEFVRLKYVEMGYRGDGEIPMLPDSVWTDVSILYQDLFERITGTQFKPGEYPVEPRLAANLKQSGVVI